tara:strand:- start:788 stop:1333 length:546 start_codon:yes stop_codon:yes gene_type:complete
MSGFIVQRKCQKSFVTHRRVGSGTASPLVGVWEMVDDTEQGMVILTGSHYTIVRMHKERDLPKGEQYTPEEALAFFQERVSSDGGAMSEIEETRKLLRLRVLDLRQPALQELIRLISSERFVFLSEEQIPKVGDYHPIEVEGEVFFNKPLSTGKEVATVLRIAWRLGRHAVRRELHDFALE